MILSDRGTEFKSSFQEMLRYHDIRHYHPHNPDVKAGMIERYNRTLKTKLWKYFSKNKTYQWIGPLPKIIKSINNSINRTIEMKPSDVNRSNARKLYKKLYGPVILNRSFKMTKYSFKKDDKVRIAREKGNFEKGYLPNYSQEIFQIYQRIPRSPPVYRIKDMQNEKIEGTFYEQELVKVII